MKPAPFSPAPDPRLIPTTNCNRESQHAPENHAPRAFSSPPHFRPPPRTWCSPAGAGRRRTRRPPPGRSRLPPRPASTSCRTVRPTTASSRPWSSGNVSWDVVDVEDDYAAQAGKAGMLEPTRLLRHRQVQARSALRHRSFGRQLLLFLCDRLQPRCCLGECPKTWADLFDTTKFPGKRTFYKWSAPGVIEAALLADGVAPANLYPLDLDRAFKKLDTIKADIIWWSSGAQSQQLLASAEAPFGSFWNGRLTALAADGMPVETSWDQNITAADSLVVPKGAQNKAKAMKFIALRDQPKGSGRDGRRTGYAPINLEFAGPDGPGGPQDSARPAGRDPDQRQYGLLGRRIATPSASAGTLGRQSDDVAGRRAPSLIGQRRKPCAPTRWLDGNF